MGSRTSNSARNSLISLLFYGVIIFLTFLSRKVFVDALGAELLGLNTTISNLLSLLNLSEMGIATAISFTLYKPIAENDRHKIQEILSVQGWVYFIVALFVLTSSGVMLLFFPKIFSDTNLPLSYAYSTFVVFLLTSLLGYFFNYKQIMHSASQKEYKNVLIVKSLMAAKIIFQIVAIKVLLLGYQSWLIIEGGFSVITTLTLNASIRRSYNWLDVSIFKGRRIANNYPEIFTKVKQLFFHKIGGVALAQTSPLVIFAFTSLSVVAIYGNYMLILTGITTLVSAAFAGITPIIGNLIVEKNKDKERKIFGEYMALKMILGATFAHCLIIGGKEFMILWMGAEFLLPDLSFLLLVTIGYINVTRPYDSFLIPYGRVEDIWAPVVEAGINLGLSTILGYYFSLPGVLIGVIISLVVVVLGWKAYFLATKGLEVPSSILIIRYFAYSGLFVIISYVLHWIIGCFHINQNIPSFGNWSIEMLFHFSAFLILSVSILNILDNNTRNLTRRLISQIVKNK